MKTELGQGEADGFEQSARIVEAFSEGQPDDVQDLLRQITEAIRERALND